MWPFQKRLMTPFREAVKSGNLIDMQVKPYIEFNRFLQYTAPTGITPAAYRAFIDIPREKGQPGIHRAARWALLLSAIHNGIPQAKNSEITEVVVEVEIVKHSGFNQFKSVKVRVEQVPDNAAVVVMLPNEKYPLPA